MLQFRNHKLIASINGRLKHSMEIVTTQEIDIADKKQVQAIAEMAGKQSPYHPDGYGLSSPEVVKYVDKGCYLVTWWSSQSCD